MCISIYSSFSFLNDLWQIFKDATLFFSCGTPNLAMVIPAMNHIDRVLATTSDSLRFSLSIRAALVIGKNTINRYYNKTDHSETYHITMSMYYSYLCTFTNRFISFFQFFIPATSLLTSRIKAGKKPGLRLPTTLSTRSTIVRMPQHVPTVTVKVTKTTLLWVLQTQYVVFCFPFLWQLTLLTVHFILAQHL
jgi:hypothetical protein